MTREGYIEKIIYSSEETGYAVFSVETTDGEETFVGTMFGVGEGMYIQAEGEYVNHPQYDIQFKFTSCEVKMPDDVTGIERYLGSGIIKGIGEIMAKRIVKKFKMDTLRIIEEEPERLAEVKGISENMARRIAVSYQESHEYRQVIMFLSGYGINVNLAMKIYNEYGENVYKVIKENPYRIAEDISGVGFKTADELANKVGIEPDSAYRRRSAIIYTLNQAMGLGHIYLPEYMLVAKVRELLGLNQEEDYLYPSRDLTQDITINDWEAELHDQLLELAIEHKIVIKEIPVPGQNREAESGDPVQMMNAVYTTANYYMELNSARLLADLQLRYETPDIELQEAIDSIEKGLDIVLDDCQREAVKSAISSGVAVVTGGPGTGKTTIINAIIEYFSNKGMEVQLAAPTGRAAKRITESTGYKAQTLHRLLEFSGVPGEDGSTLLRFGRDTENPLECDAVIVDEASMVDSFLFYALLQALTYGTRLVLVGDIHQLPSVGAGNVLHDIIDSGCFPVTELTKIFRQAEESGIVGNAHKIKSGEHLGIHNKSNDFFFIPRRNPAEITAELKELILKNLPTYLGISPEEIQVLTPMRRYELGVETLNEKLQAAMNPAAPGLREKEKNGVIFREGDKVMQIKNNYKLEWKIYSEQGGYVLEEGLGVFNGDMGCIKTINDFDETVTVLFDDGREAVYDYHLLDELEHAFAITIHKSQGSEYPAVIIPLYNGPRKLLNRNLLYTAVTRAKRMVVLVGNINLVNQMIDNVEEQKRYTSFAERLREVFIL